MNFKRFLYADLLKWKANTKHKPLILRGARQVGKTTLIRQFAKEFDHFIELNLELKSDITPFQELDDIEQILNAIYLLKGSPKPKQQTLIFIDEIQESAKAIKQLRYFYEKLPNLHVIAAGSLLEFALQKVGSFPVGRIEYLYLHPLNFEEFLLAKENNNAVEALNTVPFPKFAYSTLFNLFHEYAIIGGMPEIVANYIEHNNIARLASNYNALWETYKDDFAKYASNNTEKQLLRFIIEQAPNEADRISFEKFGNSVYRSREVGEALRLLDLAGIQLLIYPTTNTALPIQVNVKKRPRLQFLDVGLLNEALSLQGEMLTITNLNDFYRGKIISQLINQELIAIHNSYKYKPVFWVRDKKTSSAEVDLVYKHKQMLIPIEIKSGAAGKLKSLHQFMNVCEHPYAIRLLANKLEVIDAKTISGTKFKLLNLPYFLAAKLPEYIKWFIGNY